MAGACCEWRDIVGTRVESEIMESLFRMETVTHHSVSGVEPLKMWGRKRPIFTFRKTAGWYEIRDISFWKQRDQYCIC